METTRTLRLRRANTPVRDSEHYTRGTVSRITFEKQSISKHKVFKDDEDNGDGTPNPIEIEQFVFYFEIEGSAGEPIKIKHKCSTRLNGEKYIVKGKGRGKGEVKEYNKLTKTCLKLGFITEVELKDITDAVLDRVLKSIDDTKDLKVRFKPTMDEKTNLFGIGLESLSVVK